MRLAVMIEFNIYFETSLPAGQEHSLALLSTQEMLLVTMNNEGSAAFSICNSVSSEIRGSKDRT